MADETLELTFEGEIWSWRGPSPYRRAEGLADGDPVTVKLAIGR